MLDQKTVNLNAMYLKMIRDSFMVNKTNNAKKSNLFVSKDAPIPKFGFTLTLLPDENLKTVSALACAEACSNSKRGDCKYWSFEGNPALGHVTRKQIVFLLGCQPLGCTNLPDDSHKCNIYFSGQVRDTDNKYRQTRSRRPSAAWGTSIHTHKDRGESDKGDYDLGIDINEGVIFYP